MFIHKRGEGIMIAFLRFLDEGGFVIRHAVSTGLDSENRKKFHLRFVIARRSGATTKQSSCVGGDCFTPIGVCNDGKNLKLFRKTPVKRSENIIPLFAVLRKQGEIK
jgi:hypothetical protein